MKSLPMNLSSMKKIAGDAKSTTFKHKDGHEIKVAHAALPALQRKQLEKLPVQKLADGDDNVSATPASQQTSTPDTDTSASNPPAANPEVTSMFQGAFKAEGDPAVHRANNPKLQQSLMRNPPPPGQMEVLNKQEVAHYDQGTDNVTDPSTPVAPPPASVYANQPVNAQPQAVPATPQTLNPNGTLNAPAAFNLQQKATRQQQAVDQAKGAAQANIEKGYTDQASALAQRDRDIANNFNNHTTEVTNAIKEGLINENHYMESKGSAGKVNTAIGLGLGSIGAAFTGGPNMAYDFLNKQIDRDIDAQKARSDQQKTIYGMYKDAYNSDVVAQDLAKKTMNDVYTHKMNQAAAQLATPQAAALANNFAAQKALENNQLLLNASQNAGIETANGPQGGMPQAGGTPGQPSLSPKEQEAMDAFKKNTAPKQEDQDTFEKEGTTASFPILAPGAEKFAKYGVQLHPFAKQDANEINSQVQQARQVEKVINGQKGDGSGGIHQLLDQMYTNSGRGSLIKGAGGALQRGGNKAIGAIAAGASHLLGGGAGADAASAVGAQGVGIPAFSSAQKQYETNKARLKTDLASGLKGLISVNDLDALVDKFTPAYGDKPEDVKRKEEGLINSIRNSLKTDKLEQYNLLAKPK